MTLRQTTIRWSLGLALLLLWVTFAAWQWHELGHERLQAEDALDRQCKTAHHLLVASIVSHRRMGPSFDAMAQASLEEIVKSKEIVAVSVTDRNRAEVDDSPLLAAGDTSMLDPKRPAGPSHYRWIGTFSIAPGFGARPGGGGGGGLGGGGMGGGFGGGFGRGRGRGQMEAEAESGRFQPGHTYTTTFVLDRSDVDRRLRRAGWLRVWLVGTAGVILLLLAVAWLVSMRLVEARGRERVLQSEAGHLREMGQAAAGLAHETRNPLGLVRGWTQRLAQSATSSPDVQGQARAVMEECDRVTARINQFLSFARPCTPKCQELDLRDLVTELDVILEPDLETKRLRIEPHGTDQPLVVSVDREMFRQALFNLVSNAIAFSPDEGVIEITTTRGHDGKARVEVADRGPGVAPTDVDSLFTPYYTTRSGGTGLGLAIVRRIARAHGWSTGFRPRPDGGSIFWLAEKND